MFFEGQCWGARNRTFLEEAEAGKKIIGREPEFVNLLEGARAGKT